MNRAATQDLRVRQSAAGDRRRARDGPRAERRAQRRCSSCSRLARAGLEPARPRPRRQRSTTRARRSWTAAWPQDRRRRDEPGAGPAARRPREPRLRGTTGPATRARRTAAAGTATSTRTCGRCSAAGSRGEFKTRVLRRRGPRRVPRRRCGRRSTPPAPSSRPTQGPGPRRTGGVDAAGERIVFSPGFLSDHDALDQPAHVPAGDDVQRAPAGARARQAMEARVPRRR